MNKNVFEINNNPLNTNGAMGRLCFLNYSVLIFILSGFAIYSLCPTLSKISSNPEIYQGKTFIEILSSGLPEEEIIFYVTCILGYMVLSFILNKKRFLDIIGDVPHALKSANTAAIVLFLLALQVNFTIPQGSTQATFISIGNLLIFFFMALKKGNITKP